MKRTVLVHEYGKTAGPQAYLEEMAGEPYPALLESSLHTGQLGRYSILCWDPFRKLTCREGEVRTEDLESGECRVTAGNPFKVLSAEFDSYRLDVPREFALPFAGGAVGYFSYDLRHYVEDLPRLCRYDLKLPEFVLCFYDRGLVFDHRSGKTYFVGPSDTEPPPRIPAGHRPLSPDEPPPTLLKSNFRPGEYTDAVRRVKEYIAAGDIFQANLSQRFDGPCEEDGLTLYGRLSRDNPAPFAAYLRYPNFEVISSSPERFLLLDGNRVTTRPIKGTRPRRIGDQVFNRRKRKELQGSEKDHAELAMIVDLERNDLGRVCSYGTVRVKEHAVLETYPTVYHLVSTVEGRLHREEHDEFGLLRATFPGGSITGAPKIRAMEIIEEIEPHARSIYTGSIGYISFHGRMDLNIVIRTMVRTRGRIYMQFGGGIVADSDPQMEYQETLDKGKALFEAVGATNYAQAVEES